MFSYFRTTSSFHCNSNSAIDFCMGFHFQANQDCNQKYVHNFPKLCSMGSFLPLLDDNILRLNYLLG